ncbi:uncharacterized protein TNIN_114311 [Trichonephila inaurata madagascariensis]|uniref:Uncharacterized protein n=1 Tax=Trichonephila inaurata madagascariensis TaxID=2747483 RepID=A0A8X6WVQ0_9ARAC|nr:uncharacterized protein TNIN_114311 [Trichonephila inaurata madagascariensis]
MSVSKKEREGLVLLQDSKIGLAMNMTSKFKRFQKFLNNLEGNIPLTTGVTTEKFAELDELPPEESGCLTDEEDIDENTVQSILPAYVCGKIEISPNIDNDEISHEDMFDPEVPSTTKGMSNLKRKLKSNETNVELYRKKSKF